MDCCKRKIKEVLAAREVYSLNCSLLAARKANFHLCSRSQKKSQCSACSRILAKTIQQKLTCVIKSLILGTTMFYQVKIITRRNLMLITPRAKGQNGQNSLYCSKVKTVSPRCNLAQNHIHYFVQKTCMHGFRSDQKVPTSPLTCHFPPLYRNP